MRQNDQRIYRTFEEFEREELRRSDGVGASVDDMIGAVFAEELDFEPGQSRKRPSPWDDEEE